MSDDWQETRNSFNKLKALWKEGTETDRYALILYFFGFALMGLAIIHQFGTNGLVFCFGMILWAISKS